MKLLSLTLAICIYVTTAAPAASDVVVPETGLVQVTTIDANAAAKAKHTVETMLAQGSDSSACGDLAGSILTEVEDNIKSQEELLSKFPDGSACKSEGQGVVDAAQAAIDSAQTMKSSADAAAATAASAPVDFGTYSLSSISTTSCTQFESDPTYTAAVATSQQAQNAATTAAAELTAAQNELTSAQGAQAKAIKTCECAAFTAYDTAYTKANTRSQEDLDAWNKGKHMQCVLDGTDASACDVGSPPQVTKRTLAAGVEESVCVGVETPAPTPPLTPAPTPPLTTPAPTPPLTPAPTPLPEPSRASTGALGFTGAAAGGYQLPGETLPQGYAWFGSTTIGMSCNTLCASGGRTFDAPHTVQTGHKACMFFHPTYQPTGKNWEALEAGCTDHNPPACHGANGKTPDGSWTHASCYVQCVCKA